MAQWGPTSVNSGRQRPSAGGTDSPQQTAAQWVASLHKATQLRKCRPWSSWVPFPVISGHFLPILGLGQSGPHSAYPSPQRPNAGGQRAVPCQEVALTDSHHRPWKGSQDLNRKLHSFRILVPVSCRLLAAACQEHKPRSTGPTFSVNQPSTKHPSSVNLGLSLTSGLPCPYLKIC